MKNKALGDRQRLEHILDAATAGISFLEGYTEEQLRDDLKTMMACVRAIEIVGEAANHLSDDLKATHPEVDWYNAIGMRHFVVHQYFRIDLSAVWQTVKMDLPVLVNQVRMILAAMPSEI